MAFEAIQGFHTTWPGEGVKSGLHSDRIGLAGHAVHWTPTRNFPEGQIHMQSSPVCDRLRKMASVGCGVCERHVTHWPPAGVLPSGQIWRQSVPQRASGGMLAVFGHMVQVCAVVLVTKPKSHRRAHTP